jgi:hypothetical protein
MSEEEPTVWTILIKAGDGSLHPEEVEADRLQEDDPEEPDYVLKKGYHEVGRFPKKDVAAIFQGRRKQFDIIFKPKDEE